jgi:hypothetical protein
VDPKKRVRFTTAEIIVSGERIVRPRRIPHPEALVYARVAATERALLRRLTEANAATYDSLLKVWRMQYATAVRLGLGRRLLLRRPKPRFQMGRQNPNISTHSLLAISDHKRQNPSETE